jgi:alanine dehydrogenase
MKIGILRERKDPPDKRVPFTPKQCAEIKAQYPEIDLVVEPSSIRCFPNAAYEAEGITLQEDLSDCDVLMGVKEVPKETLIAGKTYFYFSHTIKEQPYNRDLLRMMLELNIRMIDYETLTYPNGGRVLGFGRYAGIVGAYNGFLAYGKRSGRYTLKPAHACEDRIELEAELGNMVLPDSYKIVVTGKGRVGQGAIEILSALGLKEVTAQNFLTTEFSEPTYCHIDVDGYYKANTGSFDMADFFNDPTDYSSDFMKYARQAQMYIACHFWDSRAPFIYTRDDMKHPNWNIDLVADISCDIDGPVASTIRPSTIADPLYGYDPGTESETDFMNPDAIGVMAVDNLPCELPRDASEDFGSNLIQHVLPALLGNDSDGLIERSTLCENGALTPNFAYLENYVQGSA